MQIINTVYDWYLKILTPVNPNVTTIIAKLDGDYGIISSLVTSDNVINLSIGTGGTIREGKKIKNNSNIIVKKIHLIDFNHYIELIM